MKHLVYAFLLLCFSSSAFGQLRWQNVDSAYGPLPSTVHLYFSDMAIDTAPFRAFYLVADLRDKSLEFTTDTTFKRRLTPSAFHQKNSRPLVVVNGTFFSFETNQNLNVVMRNGELVSYTAPVKGRGRDSANLYFAFKGAIGISGSRKADVAWVYTDSTKKYPSAFQQPLLPVPYGKLHTYSLRFTERFDSVFPKQKGLFRIVDKKWKMETAIGGGPVLLSNGKIAITNEEERIFTGKALNDKHPRTAMGYTADRRLVILVIEGRNAVAHGATLLQEAQILKDLGCVEALNLDGGGSTCLLVNGKETVKPSDAAGQRPVPAVFIILSKGSD